MSALGIALLSLGLLAAGAGIGFYLARLGQSAEQAKLDEVEAELDGYREQVTEHFAETATRFTAIGQQYRELYEHLASGSEALCLPGKVDAALPFPPVAMPEIEAPTADELVDETPAAADDVEANEDVDEDDAAAIADADADADAEVAVEGPAPEADGEDIDELAASAGAVDTGVDAATDLGPEAVEAEADTSVASEEALTAEAGVVEGELVDDATVSDNVVELMPRNGARDDELASGSDDDDKRRYP